MALLFYDGFDCYADREECMNAGWAPEDSNSGFSTTLGKNGGGCLITTGISNNRGWIMGFARPTQSADMTVGFWVYFGALPGAVDGFCRFVTDFTTIAELMLTSSGELHVNTIGATGTVSSPIISIETWYWVELNVVFGTGAADGAYELRVDGSTITSESGLDTADGVRPVDHVVFTSADVNTDVRIDDVVIMDDSGSDFTGFLGVSYIETLTVDADGGTVDWTRNSGSNDWEMVDDADAAADDDTTYVDATTAALETRFAIPVPTVTADVVKAVQIKARLRKTDAGVKTVRGLMNVNGGTEEILFDTVGLTTEYAWLNLGIRATNDTGGTAWDTTEVGNTEIGVEIVT